MADEQVGTGSGNGAVPHPSDVDEGVARRMGWVPKDEFEGNPRHWRPASEYVERGLAELPILRERYRALDDRFAVTERKLDEQTTRMGEQTKVFAEFRDFASKAEQRAYDRAKRELEAKMDVAVAHADSEAHRQARAELEELNRQQRPAAPAAEAARPATQVPPPAPSAQRQQVDPAVTEWVRENEWFSKDAILNSVAQAIHTDLNGRKPGLSLRENLAEVGREVRARFPEKFGNARRDDASAVATPSAGQGGSRRKGKGYDDLPAEAKATCDRFVKQIPGYKREEYVKDYFAGEE